MSENDREALIDVVKRNRSVVKRMSDGYPSAVFVTDETIADAILAAGFSRAAVPDAATAAKQPEGWSTEDHQESKQEAERRWSRPVMREAEQRYQTGCINGFILGAEWQKARETFISYKAIADEAEAERDAALAAIERVRAIHTPGKLIDVWGKSWTQADDFLVCVKCTDPDNWWIAHPCATVEALDGAPEPEWEVQYGRRNRETGALHGLTGSPRDDWWLENQDRYEHVKRYMSPPLPVEGEGE